MSKESCKNKYPDVINSIQTINLFSNDLDINFKDKNGKNLLMYAVEKENLNVIKYLISKGINVYHKDNEKRNIFMYAVLRGDMEIVKFFITYLDSYYDDKGNFLLRDIFSGKFFIKKGISINEKDKQGRNALFYAVWSKNVNIVNLVINMGINALEKDKSGKTAIDYAEEMGNNEISKIILVEQVLQEYYNKKNK